MIFRSSNSLIAVFNNLNSTSISLRSSALVTSTESTAVYGDLQDPPFIQCVQRLFSPSVSTTHLHVLSLSYASDSNAAFIFTEGGICQRTQNKMHVPMHVPIHHQPLPPLPLPLPPPLSNPPGGTSPRRHSPLGTPPLSPPKPPPSLPASPKPPLPLLPPP